MWCCVSDTVVGPPGRTVFFLPILRLLQALHDNEHVHCDGDVESVWRQGRVHMLLALLASPAVPGLRPARPRGKRGMHARARAMRFHWAALDVTNTTACGWTKCYYPSSGERKHTGWLVGRPQCAKFGCPGPRGDSGNPGDVPAKTVSLPVTPDCS